MKLALGTVQFGLNYGISNTSGKVAFSEVESILLEAKKYNINTLDTAIAYGDSESVLGKAGVNKFNIVTKLPPMPKEVDDTDLWADQQIQASLARMGVDSASGLLLHKSSDLSGARGRRLFDSLQKLKERGVVNKVGVSIYNPNELEDLADQDMVVDIVQAPFNILDRRLESSGWLEKLDSSGVELHTRSVFLQGLLLQEKDQRDTYFDKWRDYFNKFDEWILDTKQTPLSASLNFSYSYKEINKTIVGVQSKLQLTEILTSISQNPQTSIPRELEIDDPLLINPTNWET